MKQLKGVLLWDFAPLWLFSLMLAALCALNWSYAKVLFVPSHTSGTNPYLGPIFLGCAVGLIVLAVGSLLLARLFENVMKKPMAPLVWWLLIMPNIACGVLFFLGAIALILLTPAAMEMVQQVQQGPWQAGPSSPGN